MIRRSFLAGGLILLGFGRQTRSAPLTTPVRIPLDAVAAPWRPVRFKAEAIAPARGTTAARRVLLSGVLFRRSGGDEQAALSALCLTCTHEQCEVDFVQEPKPVFFCACHSSIFDATDEGAWLAGPAPRGLFRFRCAVKDSIVEVTDVEEDALFAV